MLVRRLLISVASCAGLAGLLGVVWAALMCVLLWQAPDVSRSLFWVSTAFPAYYLLLSLRLSAGRRDATSAKR